MDETQMMHGRDWSGQDLAGWWLSEKLHGCRAYWDGALMWSRGGCMVDVPAQWKASLPKVELDGEIWAGYGQFKTALRATNYGRFSADTRFMVFDVNIPGTFGKRYAETRRAVSGLSFAIAVPHSVCGSTREAVAAMQRFQRAGGEGAVARTPANEYAAGRTWEILKLKRANWSSTVPGADHR